jgi:anti-anti-sigma factor
VQFGTEWCSAAVVPDAPGERVVVTVEGELDVASAGVVAAALAAAERTGCPTVVVDVARLRFLDLSGARVLLAAAEGLQVDGRVLLLRRPTHAVTLLLDAAGLAGALPVAGGGEADVAPPEGGT